jgi:GAF domain-containing protein
VAHARERAQAKHALAMTDESFERARRLFRASSDAVREARDESSLLEAQCRIFVELGGYRLAGVGYAEDDEARTLKPVAAVGDRPENVSAMRLSWSAHSPWGQGPAGQCVRTGLPVAYADLDEQAQGFPWRQAALANGYHGAIALPLRGPSRVFGFIGLFSAQARSLPESELALLQQLADQVAQAIIAMRRGTPGAGAPGSG